MNIHDLDLLSLSAKYMNWGVVKLLNIKFMAKPKPEASFPGKLETLSFSFFYQVLKELVVFPRQTWKNIFKQSILFLKYYFANKTKQNKIKHTILFLLPPWYVNVVEEYINSPLNSFGPREKSTRLYKNSRPTALCLVVVRFDHKVAEASK